MLICIIRATFDTIIYFIGVAVLIPFGPFVAWQIACSTLWEFLDKHTIRGIQGVEYFSGKVGPYFSELTRHPKIGLSACYWYIWLSLCQCLYHWVVMFHGVIPGVFTVSHLYNHWVLTLRQKLTRGDSPRIRETVITTGHTQMNWRRKKSLKV